MADLICFMKVNFALPAANVIFATDAQGGNDDDANDAGGFGIVAADLASAETLECWKSSFQPGKAFANWMVLWGLVSRLVPLSSPLFRSRGCPLMSSTKTGRSLWRDDGDMTTISLLVKGGRIGNACKHWRLPSERMGTA